MPAIDAERRGQNVRPGLGALGAREMMQYVYTVIAKESETRSEPAQPRLFQGMRFGVSDSCATRRPNEDAEHIEHLEHDKRSLILALTEIIRNSATQTEQTRHATDLLAKVSSVS